MKHQILLVDDNQAFIRSTTDFLQNEGFGVTAKENGDEAVALIRQGISSFSLALVDYHMPQLSGVKTIDAIKKADPSLTVFAFSGDDSDEAHNNALEAGAVFFIQKDISDTKLLGHLHRVCNEINKKTKVIKVASHSENQKIIEKIGMIGVSANMASVAHLVLKYALSDGAVLIRGENGTGKEKIAKAIHKNSSRADKPFIAINCAAIPEHLIESELFGFEKGSFTGALKNKEGLFQAADGGTLFLDEIGDLPKHIQVKLLRALQEKTILPVGATETKNVDFRLISATNAPLEHLIKIQKFREDLYYRLNVLPIHVPALRDRVEDIPILALHFLEQENLKNNVNKKLLEKSCTELKKLPWRGNVRELEHYIRRFVTTANEEYLDFSSIESIASKDNEKFSNIFLSKDKKQLTEQFYIKKALSEGGNVAAAARVLKMSRSTLRDKIKKYRLELSNNK